MERAKVSMIAVVCVSCLGFSGCEEKEPAAPGTTTPGPADTLRDRASSAANSAMETLDKAGTRVSDAIARGKDEVVAAAREGMNALNPEIDRLRARGNALASEAKPEFDRAMADVDQRAAALGTKIDELGKSTGEAWRDLAAGVGTAMNDLGASIKSAWERYK